MFDILLLVIMLGILVSLGSALVFMVRDSGKTQRTVLSLSIRVALSVLLLILLAFGFATKYLMLGS
jgi:hypothetical protein